MSFSPERASVRTIERTASQLGVELPKPYLAAVSKVRHIAEQAEMINGSEETLNYAVLAAIRDGRDYQADPAVQKALLDYTLTNSDIRSFSHELSAELIGELITEHADEILSTWAAATESDCQTLMDAAAEKLGEVAADLSAPSTHDLRQRKLLNTWSDAMSAAERLATAFQGWKAIISVTKLPRHDRYEALALAVATPEKLYEAGTLRAPGSRVDAWALARAGAQLGLATITAYRERVSEVAAAEQVLREGQTESDGAPRPRQTLIRVSAARGVERVL